METGSVLTSHTRNLRKPPWPRLSFLPVCLRQARACQLVICLHPPKSALCFRCFLSTILSPCRWTAAKRNHFSERLAKYVQQKNLISPLLFHMKLLRKKKRGEKENEKAPGLPSPSSPLTVVALLL